jgi:hypothetical protein
MMAEDVGRRGMVAFKKQKVLQNGGGSLSYGRERKGNISDKIN